MSCSDIYLRRVLGLDPPVAGVYRTATKDDVLAGVRVNAGQTVFASVADACLDVSSERMSTAAGITDFLDS